MYLTTNMMYVYACYSPKTLTVYSCLFTRVAPYVSFPFMLHLFSVLVKMFYIHTVFAISLHLAVNDVYRECMQASCSHIVKRMLVSLIAPLRIVLALASHSSLNHSLCLRAFFAPVLQTLCLPSYGFAS